MKEDKFSAQPGFELWFPGTESQCTTKVLCKLHVVSLKSYCLIQTTLTLAHCMLTTAYAVPSPSPVKIFSGIVEETKSHRNGITNRFK